MFSQIGMGELLVLLAVVVLLFGPKRIPELASSIGKSIRNFKQGLKEDPEADKQTSSSPEK